MKSATTLALFIFEKPIATLCGEPNLYQIFFGKMHMLEQTKRL